MKKQKRRVKKIPRSGVILKEEPENFAQEDVIAADRIRQVRQVKFSWMDEQICINLGRLRDPAYDFAVYSYLCLICDKTFGLTNRPVPKMALELGISKPRFLQSRRNLCALDMIAVATKMGKGGRLVTVIQILAPQYNLAISRREPRWQPRGQPRAEGVSEADLNRHGLTFSTSGMYISESDIGSVVRRISNDESLPFGSVNSVKEAILAGRIRSKRHGETQETR